MSETAVFKVCVRGRDLSREDALTRFRAAATTVGLSVGEEELEVRTFPPLALQRRWPDRLPDPVWVVAWKRESRDA